MGDLVDDYADALDALWKQQGGNNDDPLYLQFLAFHKALQSANARADANEADARRWRKHSGSFAVLQAMLDAASPLVLNRLKAQEAAIDHAQEESNNGTS